MLKRLRTRIGARRRVQPAPDDRLERTTVGCVLVVHPAGGMSEQARVLALSPDVDPEHDLVVVDALAGTPIRDRELVAAAIPAGDRAIRFVPVDLGGDPRLDGPWLADRLGRPVVVPVGTLRPSAGGLFFDDAVRDGGWYRFAPGAESEWAGKRLPRPAWDSPGFASLKPLGTTSVAEPLPAGVWLRSVGTARWLEPHRARLIRWARSRPGEIVVVLGGEGLPELPLEAFTTWWESLTADERTQVRVVRYGPVESPAGDPVGQTLADLLGTEIVQSCGLPVGTGQSAAVVALRPDGSHGWPMFAHALTYRPRGPEDTIAPTPVLRSHRKPLSGLPEVSPGVYQYDSDVVLEVVQAGVWVRTPDEPVYGDSVRALPADPAVPQVLHDMAGSGLAARLWDCAEKVAERLAPAIGARPKVVLTDGVEPAPATGYISHPRRAAAFAAEPAPEPEQEPAEEEEPLVYLLQLVTAPDGDAALPAQSGPPTAAAAAESQPVPQPLTTKAGAAAALALYLGPFGTGIDDALRDGGTGEQAVLGRRAAASMAALPVHHGVTSAALSSDAVPWDLVRDLDILVEPGFFALPVGSGSSGETDLLVWSSTGRLTASLEPDSGRGRVLFAPGTGFLVLAAEAPAGDRRGRILLRELATTETDLGAYEGLNSLDQMILESLRDAGDRLSTGDTSPSGPWSERLPGLARAGRAGAGRR
ncbi:hypothetical protein [Amycolatopsis sp. WQ 127309]|uniref:hypothetical protein n=1 Tax=Amycolatopsis sp. WQ 127309 TaxID=2932773 RepID=UPI001FF4876C|nr:hypothetical protein [Amycolatopsis sp. WQ 127309]UOZ06974.1 hypothetical protein MUY22_01375 [Amycolatopsis sp. WQ 127309]